VRVGIPGGTAAGLGGGGQAAGGEGGGVGLAPDEVGAGKFQNDPAAARVGDEAVVLFGGDAVQRLEPVGKVGGAVLNGPILHGVGHDVGHLRVETFGVLDGLPQLPIGLGRQPLALHVVVKGHAAENFGGVAHSECPLAYQFSILKLYPMPRGKSIFFCIQDLTAPRRRYKIQQ